MIYATPAALASGADTLASTAVWTGADAVGAAASTAAIYAATAGGALNAGTGAIRSVPIAGKLLLRLQQMNHIIGT